MLFARQAREDEVRDLRAELAEARVEAEDLRVDRAHLAYRVDTLAAENQRLRQDLADAGAEPARTTARLSADERRELHLLREQNRALEERLADLTARSMAADWAGVSR
jgi:chromosome segregation ATPase